MDLLHMTARTLVEWMAYGLVEGTLLTLFVVLLLRLFPRQNAGTRFALWFSVLLAMLVLPFAGRPHASQILVSQNGTPGSSLITLPAHWALTIFAFWTVIAAAGLIRLLAGLAQVSRLRRDSQAIDPQSLSTEVRQMLSSFSRPVSLRSSERVQVPAAIGFFKPVILLPQWFVKELSPLEFKHVLLHELSHLRRRDDWTNLAQKIISTLLFFHPSAWWVERRLTLEREMACDEAVLAQTPNPHDYARCLKHVAEKSYLRRQLSLMQAVVSRMRQLSVRVASIMDVNRRGGTRLWKPAVPVVLLAASLCGYSAWNAPALLTFKDNVAPHAITVPAMTNDTVKAINTSSEQMQPQVVLAKATMGAARPAQAAIHQVRHAPKVPARNVSEVRTGDYVVSEQFIVTMTSDRNNTWQVRMWQVRVVLPVDAPSKPVSRKNI